MFDDKGLDSQKKNKNMKPLLNKNIEKKKHQTDYFCFNKQINI